MMTDQFFLNISLGTCGSLFCLEWDGMDADVAMCGVGIMPGYFIG